MDWHAVNWLIKHKWLFFNLPFLIKFSMAILSLSTILNPYINRTIEKPWEPLQNIFSEIFNHFSENFQNKSVWVQIPHSNIFKLCFLTYIQSLSFKFPILVIGLCCEIFGDLGDTNSFLAFKCCRDCSLKRVCGFVIEGVVVLSDRTCMSNCVELVILRDQSIVKSFITMKVRTT